MPYYLNIKFGIAYQCLMICWILISLTFSPFKINGQFCLKLHQIWYSRIFYNSFIQENVAKKIEAIALATTIERYSIIISPCVISKILTKSNPNLVS